MAVTKELLSDLEIARSIPLQPIGEVAQRLGVLDDELGTYGQSIATLDAQAILERSGYRRR